MNIPTFSQNTDPVLRKLDRFIEVFVFVIVFVVTPLVCCSCGSTRVATQVVERVSKDTIYLSNVQYDSIYIFQDHVSEHHLGALDFDTSTSIGKAQPMRTDTLYIKDVSIEYRYKLLKDTIRVVERDSIPYEVTITEVKKIQRPLTWCDHLTRSVFWTVIVIVIVIVAKPIIRLIRKIKR